MAGLGRLGAFLDRQERSVVSRLGGGLPVSKAFMRSRWDKEAVADIGSVAVALNAAVEAALLEMPAQDAHVLVADARAIYASLRERLRSGLSESTGRHMVYKLYSALGDLLYIGITNRGPSRLSEHYRHKPWFADVTRIELERFETRQLAADRERTLIQVLAPLHNIQHNRRGVGPKTSAARGEVERNTLSLVQETG